ncbi:M23 family metallopeptidase [Brevibacillus centrosporus]|uniref:M23 family metallopeptidase n=1 Tax=Brevibacillus centrosporus TaxID=54910 RepID=UPI0011437B3B|nr:M23 family metallopeptidase [Brevibacillus centrosporus]MEC2133324.1 M23 family metallopeptidase [Brevibacillus centrosporus]GED33920.1 hypothetical protein BCE02nite_50610 [Brevibacillus centrosporus]
MSAPKYQGGSNLTTKITQKAFNTSKDIAGRLIGIAGRRGGSVVNNFGKELAKKAIKELFKLIARMILKTIIWFIATYGLVAFLAILVIIIVSMSLYLYMDSDGDGLKDQKGVKHYEQYVELAKTTVDPNKPEQFFFRSNEYMLMVASNMAEQKGVMSATAAAQSIIDAVQPSFTYEPITEWDMQRVCKPDGSCSAPYKANERKVKLLTEATNYIGTWALEYEVKPVPISEQNSLDPSLQMIEDHTRDHKGSWHTVSCDKDSCIEQKDHKAYLQRKYVTKPDLTRLTDAFAELEFQKFDFELFQVMYNEAVEQNLDIYFTNLENIDGYGDGISSGDRTGAVDTNIVQRPPTPDMLNAGEWMWPTPTITHITSNFGKRLRNGAFEGHQGIDIAPSGGKGLAAGHMVYAPRDGTVIKAGKSNGYGIAVFIKHKDGMTTELGHLQYNGIFVKVGDYVKKGDPVATIGYGKVGDSSGPHLHVSIDLPNSRVRTNPIYYIRPPK